MKNRSAIEEVLLSLPDTPETKPMKQKLRDADTPEGRTAVIKAFLDEHGDRDAAFMGKAK